jgi:propanol-preferring alcohol dehydrogenase
MQAYRIVAPRTAELREVPVPEPGPGQVLLKVAGAGACHSDLHLMDGPADRLPKLPFTLGHENAGWVEKLGPGANGFAPGDPVMVYGPWGCGTCGNCRVGMENYCENPGAVGAGGLGSDGGMAPYMLVPSTRFLIPLGTLDPREAAPLADAALTSYHAVKRSLRLLGPGSTAVVIGAGGLGQMAIQTLRALSAATTVVAVDTAPDKLATAKRMGADEALISGDEAVARIKHITRGQGAQLVLDMVGMDATLRLAARVARARGDVTIVGLGGGAFPVNFDSAPHECSVASPYWGAIGELMEVVTLAQAGKLRMLVEQFPLERAAEAYQLLRQGKIPFGQCAGLTPYVTCPTERPSKLRRPSASGR